MSRKRADNLYAYREYFKLVRSPIGLYLYTNIAQVAAKIAKFGILPENTYNMDDKGFLIGVLQRLDGSTS